jgi:hypothetical protein
LHTAPQDGARGGARPVIEYRHDGDPPAGWCRGRAPASAHDPRVLSTDRIFTVAAAIRALPMLETIIVSIFFDFVSRNYLPQCNFLS